MTAIGNFLKLQITSPKQKLIPILFMLCFLVYSAIQNYKYLDSGVEDPRLNLSISTEEWSKITFGGDAGGYLDIANHIVAGHGFSRSCPTCNPPSYAPTDYWGPGTPYGYALALWIGKLFGFTSMKVIFYYVFLCDFISNLIIMATFWLFTQNFAASLMAAFFCGFCPGFHLVTYSSSLSSSENISAIPLAIMFYFLAKAFQNFWKMPKPSKRYFAYAGLALGLASLSRESNFQFVYFTIAGFLVEVVVRNRKKLKPALLLCLIFFIVAFVPRRLTKHWNRYRIGNFIVGQAGIGTMPGPYYFSEYEYKKGFIDTIGIRVGDYLDPEAGVKVRELMSKGWVPVSVVAPLLIKAILKNPLKYLAFKLERLPVLYISTDRYPYVQIGFVNKWIILVYLIFFFYIGYMAFYRKKWPPEITYHYFIFLLVAYLAVIHAEYRYSYPVLMTLRIVPALFMAQLIQDFVLNKQVKDS